MENTALDKAKQHVIFPVGTSGSGKSTWCKTMKGYDIISIDKIRLELTGSLIGKDRDSEIYQIGKEKMINSLINGNNVIIDATNLTKAKRFPFVKEINHLFPFINIYYKLMPLIEPIEAKKRIEKALSLGIGDCRADVDLATIQRHYNSYEQALKDLKEENLLNFDLF